ncbi:hypothetical protein KAU33_16495 [Candidatus Dependentiae bacterium]|nr:hypothetical protein [Candidatus Dependentiae bacterium]
MNKKNYYKKGYFLVWIIVSIIPIIFAFTSIELLTGSEFSEFDFTRVLLYIDVIIWSIVVSLCFIFAYQTIKLPNIIFMDDEMTQYIGVFRIKNEIKINDIVNFETVDFKTGELCKLGKGLIFTLKNDKIKRLRFAGISKSDMEYIINLLKEEYNLKLIPRV